MASQKEEPNTSMLFGNATDDDPFSQLSQETPTSNQPSKPASGDVSSLFGNTSAGNADLFFSSTNATANTTPQTANQPLTTSSAASFFDQPQSSNNFFDNLGQDNAYQQQQQQQQQQVPAATNYDPNAYDYSQQQQPEYNSQQQQQPQEQQYDQSQWIQFDPNVHYYYDEQGYAHYYDPNTNQEYDMSQYQPQAVQFDPNVHYYYDEQGYVHYYDPNTNQEYDMSQYDQSQGYDYSQPAQENTYDQQTSNYEATGENQTEQYSGYDPQQYNTTGYEPVDNTTTTVPETTENHTDNYSNYEPQQYNTTGYEPVKDIPVTAAPPTSLPEVQQTSNYGQVDIAKEDNQPEQYSGYEPQPFDTSSYEPVHKDTITAPPTNLQDTQQTSNYGQVDISNKNQPEQYGGYEPQPFDTSSYEPVHENKSVTAPPTNILDAQQPSSYGQADITNENQFEQYNSYEPQQYDFSSYEPVQEHKTVKDPSTGLSEAQQTDNYDQVDISGGNQSEQYNGYEPQQLFATNYEPSHGNETTTAPPSGPPKTEEASFYGQLDNFVGNQTEQYSGYEPQQSYALSYEPAHEQEIKLAPPSGPPKTQEDTTYDNFVGNQTEQYNAYEPQQLYATNYEPVDNVALNAPPPSSPPKVQQRVVSPPPPPRANSGTAFPPPPRVNSINSVSSNTAPPRANSIHSVSSTTAPPRANSIHSISSSTAPPRATSIKSISSPPQSHFIQSLTSPSMMTSTMDHPYYVPPATIERSATVPPPITERIASPRPQLVPCPDPQCEGENKPKAKFCCECGRPLAGISRSTTPAANLSSVPMEPFPPMTSFAEQMQRNVLDDAVKAPISEFLQSSVVVHQDRQLALDYVQRRVSGFDESKALLWNIVKTMLEHSDCTLGDGGSLDKAIVQMMVGSEDRISTTRLDELEDMLLDGDREKACEFASSHDMWGHSFIIATGNSELFKHTMSKFIQRELFSSSGDLMPQVTGNNKALRLLYSTFNGAGADAVTEFLKQAVNDDGAYTEESFAGWKRALALVLANRSPDDQKVIYELGEQLKKIASRKDDAQLCFMFSPDVTGNNLLGDNMYTDLDALFLCEFYEFASKVTVQQDFKLILAWWMSELGFTEESAKYVDSIASVLQNTTSCSVEDLRKIGDISPSASNEITTSLSKQKFDSLISSIEEKSKSQVADSGYGGYGYGYGYDNSVSVSAEVPNAVTSPFAKPRGIQSPFQSKNDTIKPVSSPFGVQPPNAVSSPFGQTYTPAANDSSNGSWWDSTNVPAATTEPKAPSYEPEATSYEPETSYQPPAQTETAPSYNDDDDDDLGFGNSKTRKGAKLSEQVETTDKQAEQKVPEVKDEPEPEHKEKSGWGLFSLFGRQKDANSDEKKPIKANLGGGNQFYYDEKEKRWVNKLNDSKPAAATPPPPPKSLTPQPTSVATPPPPSGVKPNSMPPPRINSAPTVGGPPSGAPPTFNTPPVSSRRGAGGKKPMRSRYVDVFNQS